LILNAYVVKGYAIHVKLLFWKVKQRTFWSIP